MENLQIVGRRWSDLESRGKIKTLTCLALALMWSWRDLNPRPNVELMSFLHA